MSAHDKSSLEAAAQENTLPPSAASLGFLFIYRRRRWTDAFGHDAQTFPHPHPGPSRVQAIRDVRQDHASWISIDRVHDRLAVEDLRIVDAAVAFASAKGWLALGGQPAHSVLLNRSAP
jgi:hypothetical protein